MTTNPLLNRAHELAPKLVELRRAIHRHPELSFQEHKTAALAANTLRSLDIRVDTGVGRTGVVGHLGKSGPLVALRADMDALPIQEINQVDYASQVPGVMHACGHDVHTACLLGAAMLLSEIDLPGRVRLLFQPSEEGMDEEGKSGAMLMVEEGVMDSVQAIFGLHVHGCYQAGEVICTPGPMAAAMDNFRAVIRGRATHGAYPHQGIDAILLASQVVNTLHTIISRRISPLDSGVISVGMIHGGTKENNLTDLVELRGTIRSFDKAIRSKLIEEVDRACQTARTLGGDYELAIRTGFPPVINDEKQTDLVRKTARKMVGLDKVLQRPPEMGGEDFSFYLQHAPGCFFEIGIKSPGQPDCPVHTPNFDIDDSALPLGAALLAGVALDYLNQL